GRLEPCSSYPASLRHPPRARTGQAVAHVLPVRLLQASRRAESRGRHDRAPAGPRALRLYRGSRDALRAVVRSRAHVALPHTGRLRSRRSDRRPDPPPAAGNAGRPGADRWVPGVPFATGLRIPAWDVGLSVTPPTRGSAPGFA